MFRRIVAAVIKDTEPRIVDSVDVEAWEPPDEPVKQAALVMTIRLKGLSESDLQTIHKDVLEVISRLARQWTPQEVEDYRSTTFFSFEISR